MNLRAFYDEARKVVEQTVKTVNRYTDSYHFVFDEIGSNLHAESPYSFRERKAKELEQWFTKKGCKFIGQGLYSRAFALATPWGEMVFKFSMNLVNAPTQETINANPVLRKRFLRPLFSSPHVMVQPRCKMRRDIYSRLWEAGASKLRKMIFEASPRHTAHDCHGGNIGYWRGQMRIFDAMA